MKKLIINKLYKLNSDHKLLADEYSSIAIFELKYIDECSHKIIKKYNSVNKNTRYVTNVGYRAVSIQFLHNKPFIFFGTADFLKPLENPKNAYQVAEHGALVFLDFTGRFICFSPYIEDLSKNFIVEF